MSQGLRVKEIRKILKLNQTEFGNQLGVSVDVVSNIEIGRVDLKQYMQNLICKTFNVNPTYLETGKGKMFKEENLLEEVKKAYSLSNDELKLIKCFLRLNKSDKEVVLRASKLFSKVFQNE